MGSSLGGAAAAAAAGWGWPLHHKNEDRRCAALPGTARNTMSCCCCCPPIHRRLFTRLLAPAQIFNLEAKAKLKSVQFGQQVVFWKWISATKLGLVTATSVYHWDMQVRPLVRLCGRQLVSAAGACCIQAITFGLQLVCHPAMCWGWVG